MHAGAGNDREIVAGRIGFVNLLGGRVHAGVAVDLPGLHGQELGIRIRHIEERGAVELDLTVPVLVVANDLHISLRLEGLDHKRSRADGSIVKICGGVQIHDRKLGVRQRDEHGREDVRGRDDKGLFILGLESEGRPVIVALVDLDQTLEVARHHIGGNGIAVGEAGVRQREGPGQAVFADAGILRQQRADRHIRVDPVQGLGHAVDLGVPAVVVLMGVQAGIGEVCGHPQPLGLLRGRGGIRGRCSVRSRSRFGSRSLGRCLLTAGREGKDHAQCKQKRKGLFQILHLVSSLSFAFWASGKQYRPLPNAAEAPLGDTNFNNFSHYL